MKHSDLKKETIIHSGVVCSGKKRCYSCKQHMKSSKRLVNKVIRRKNKILGIKELVN